MLLFDKIVTAGCSFTYGKGLADPVTQSWPGQLSEIIGIPAINLGTPAAGNQYITRRIVEHESEHELDNTLVIIAWSHWHRVDFCDQYGKVHHMVPNARDSGPFVDQIFTEYYNKDYLYQRYLITITMMQSFLDHKRVPYLMFDALNGLHNGEYMSNATARNLSRRIDTERFIGFGKGNFDTWTDAADRLSCGHPNARAHAQMAKLLERELINRYAKDDHNGNDY